MWYANFYYTDWTGQKQHVCKRGFKTQREAKAYEENFLSKQNNRSENVLLEMKDENGKQYSETYLRTIHNQLSAILNYAVKHYGLASNPCHARIRFYW